MSKKLSEKAKVSPEVLQLIYQDEIAGKIGDLLDLIKSERPQGLTPQHQLTIMTYLEFMCSPPWFAFTLFNDGPDPVYMNVNRVTPINPVTPPLNKGESLTVDMKTAKIEKLFFQTVAGQTANIRLFVVV